MVEIKLAHLDEVIYHDTCDNGLKIYLWVNEKVKSFYATLNIRYGSVDTEFKLPNQKTYTKVPDGIAHFLEHMKFHELDGSTAFDYFSKLGSNINAFTTFDYTAYQTTASAHFKENIDHLLNYVFTPVFKTKDIKEEVGIITEEIKMYDDMNSNQLYLKTLQSLYQKDKTRIPIIGSIEEIKKVTSKNLQLIFDNFYHPQNSFIVITGNFNKEEAISIIKENQAKFNFLKYKEPKRKNIKEPQCVVNELVELYQNREIPLVNVSFKINRKLFKNIENLNLQIYLNAILNANFGITSKLREDLFKNEIITKLKYITRVKNDMVVITLQVETLYPNDVAKRLQKAFAKLNLTEKVLNRQKKIEIANLVQAYDDIEIVNTIIQDDIIVYNKIVADMYNIFKRMNLKKVQDIINSMDLTNTTIVIAYPKEEE